MRPVRAGKNGREFHPRKKRIDRRESGTIRIRKVPWTADNMKRGGRNETRREETAPV